MHCSGLPIQNEGHSVQYDPSVNIPQASRARAAAAGGPLASWRKAAGSGGRAAAAATHPSCASRARSELLPAPWMLPKAGAPRFIPLELWPAAEGSIHRPPWCARCGWQAMLCAVHRLAGAWQSELKPRKGQMGPGADAGAATMSGRLPETIEGAHG